MSTLDPQLDLFQARKAKANGIARVSSSNSTWLRTARAVACRIASERGEVTADDVREVLYKMGLKPRHYNAWGAVFQNKDLRWTGRFKQSAVVEGHGNLQRVWELA